MEIVIPEVITLRMSSGCIHLPSTHTPISRSASALRSPGLWAPTIGQTAVWPVDSRVYHMDFQDSACLDHCKGVTLHLKYICTYNLLYTWMNESDLNPSSKCTESLNMSKHIVILPKSTVVKTRLHRIHERNVLSNTEAISHMWLF